MCIRDSSHSCKSHANRRNYSVTIANRKSDQQIYWIDGKQYQLRPGHQHTFTKLIGKTHQCRRGSLALPLVEFDRYDNDRHFSSRKVRLSERSRSYYFDRGLNIVTLKKRWWQYWIPKISHLDSHSINLEWILDKDLNHDSKYHGNVELNW